MLAMLRAYLTLGRDRRVHGARAGRNRVSLARSGAFGVNLHTIISSCLLPDLNAWVMECYYPLAESTSGWNPHGQVYRRDVSHTAIVSIRDAWVACY